MEVANTTVTHVFKWGNTCRKDTITPKAFDKRANVYHVIMCLYPVIMCISYKLLSIFNRDTNCQFSCQSLGTSTTWHSCNTMLCASGQVPSMGEKNCKCVRTVHIIHDAVVRNMPTLMQFSLPLKTYGVWASIATASAPVILQASIGCWDQNHIYIQFPIGCIVAE